MGMFISDKNDRSMTPWWWAPILIFCLVYEAVYLLFF